MLEHPWIELQLLIKEKWLTQKAFASILWKKVSEVNELLKWKRNITIQRDYLLHQTLWTPIKYRILKQIDYDYSLIDINEEPSVSPLIIEEEQGEIESQKIPIEKPNPKEDEDSSLIGEGQGEVESQEIPTQEPDSKDDEDFKKRAKIFKSF